jgi:hypothetical protein
VGLAPHLAELPQLFIADHGGDRLRDRLGLGRLLLGIFLFSEHIQTAIPYLAGEAAALAIVIAGAMVLSHSQLIMGEDGSSPTLTAGYHAHSHRQQAER